MIIRVTRIQFGPGDFVTVKPKSPIELRKYAGKRGIWQSVQGEYSTVHFDGVSVAINTSLLIPYENQNVSNV